MHTDRIHAMKCIIIAAALLAGTPLTSEAADRGRGLACIARVVHSEELPYAPMGSWLIKATLDITTPDGRVFGTTVKDWMPWQGPPPRRGQTFRVWCDPANPGDLHAMHGTMVRTVF